MNIEHTLAQYQESEHLLKDKMEDLKNKTQRNNLCFICIHESLTGADLLTFLSTVIQKH